MSTKIFLNSKGNTAAIDQDIACFLQYVNGKAAEVELALYRTWITLFYIVFTRIKRFF